MAEKFSEFDTLLAAGWTGAEIVEAAGLFNGQNVKFPAVVQGIDAVDPDPALTNAVMKGGNSINDDSAGAGEVFGGNAPGAGSGGSAYLTGGTSVDGPGGPVYVDGGTSTNGSKGTVTIGDPGAQRIVIVPGTVALVGPQPDEITPGVAFLILGQTFNLSAAGLPNFADDAAAASGGVAVDQMYRTGSIIKVRVS